jgi:hypothetical protein
VRRHFAPRSRHIGSLLLGLAGACGAVTFASEARAEDGSNDVCPALSADADDVRDEYDAQGRLVHELRLAQGRVVEEVAVSYRDGHAVARTEVTPERRRVARSYFRDDRVSVAECYEGERRVGYASYEYDGDGHLLLLDKRSFVEGTAGEAPVAPHWTRETTHHRYDADGQVIATEVRDTDGHVKSRTTSERVPLAVPVVLSFSAGGTYQSDTQLYDFLGALGIHREPKVEHYGEDPLSVGLDAAYRFHRASGATTMDQTTLRLGVDYHDIVPRITLFTFATTERNVPANLRLNLEVAVLGVKYDFVPPKKYQLDVSFAPVWNFRSIFSPQPDGTRIDETTSKLRGSLRARAGLHFAGWSLVDTFEFLPTLYGDDAAPEDDFWHRTVVRNTVSFDVTLSPLFTLHEVFKYTWDSAMRAQATCPDAENPLCLGYAFSSTTALSLNVDL